MIEQRISTGLRLLAVALVLACTGAAVALAAPAVGPGAQSPLPTASSGRQSVPRLPHAPHAVLWDQPLTIDTNYDDAYVSQAFPDFPSFSTYLADDFVNAVSWSIDEIFVPGDFWNEGTTLLNATSLTFQIWADNAGVPDGNPESGTPFMTVTVPPTDLQVVLGNGSPGGLPSNVTLLLTTPWVVPPGHWWLVFYPTMSFSPDGQYGRQGADTTNGHVGQGVNPGDGFGVGTEWLPWTTFPGGPTHDLAFRLDGIAYQAPAITSAGAVAFTIGRAGSFTVTATGLPTPALGRDGALPAGVTFCDNYDGTATLEGTPAKGTGGRYQLTLTASNGEVPNATQEFTLTVLPTARTVTTVVSSANPARAGYPVRFTARVTFFTRTLGTPTGTIQFKVDGADLGPPVRMTSAQASSWMVMLPERPEPYAVTAEYSGDGNFLGSTGTLPGGQVAKP